MRMSSLHLERFVHRVAGSYITRPTGSCKGKLPNTDFFTAAHTPEGRRESESLEVYVTVLRIWNVVTPTCIAVDLCGHNILTSLGFGVIPGILPLLATGSPATSWISAVKSIGLDPLM